MKKLALALALISMPCFAQDKPSPDTRALTDRVMWELNSSLRCQSYNYALEDRIKTAEAEVKRLTDKYEPKGREGP